MPPVYRSRGEIAWYLDATRSAGSAALVGDVPDGEEAAVVCPSASPPPPPPLCFAQPTRKIWDLTQVRGRFTTEGRGVGCSWVRLILATSDNPRPEGDPCAATRCA